MRASAIVILAGTLIVSTAVADESTDSDRGHRRMRKHHRRDRPSREEMIATYDADGDGKLSETEKETAMQARLNERVNEFFAEHDTNGDGSISREEVTAAWKERHEKMRADRPAKAGKEKGACQGPCPIAQEASSDDGDAAPADDE